MRLRVDKHHSEKVNICIEREGEIDRERERERDSS
jgi:hypothetical protein